MCGCGALCRVFAASAQFTTWIYRIAVNTCLNRKRQLRAQLRVVDGEDTLQDWTSGEPDALATTMDEETRRASGPPSTAWRTSTVW